MAHNHLIIGLGGTGGNIIRSFRKTVYQQCSSNDPENVNVRYLYIDSNESDLNQPWTILGHSVGLPVYSRLPIPGLNLKGVMEDIGNYGAIKPWIGNRSDWVDILNSIHASKIVGSQKRRLGRFLFAPHVELFHEKVRTLVEQMETHPPKMQAPQAGTTFHVCCGLAGGTGSGTVIDVISQIRAVRPGKNYRIYLYVQLPEEHAGTRDTGNYHANGYAALMELNALKINSWHPHDIRYKDGRRLDIQDPFTSCYLFSDENEAGRVSVEELPDIVASFLFQKIVLAPNVDWGTGVDQIEFIETFENIEAGVLPEMSPGQEPQPRRTRSFLSFGVMQIAYPEVEIGEYLVYSFAQQAARQLLYNHWKDGIGYVKGEMKFDCKEYVAKPEQQERWCLDDQHLMLSSGILQSEFNNATWKPIDRFWKDLIPDYLQHVQEQYKDTATKMMPELIKLCETAYDEQYRGHGVRAFYRIKLGDNNTTGDMKDQVSTLREHIETDLFMDWLNGKRSIHDIERILISLVNGLQAKLLSIDASTSKVSDSGERYKKNEEKYKENNIAWGRLGPLSITFGKHNKILNAQASVLATRYTMLTELEGYRYARKLVENLLRELNSLSADIGGCKARIIESEDAFTAEISTRLGDAGESDIGKQLVRHYDPVAVKTFVQNLCRNQERQFIQCGEVRDRLTDQLNGKRTFASFATISRESFYNTLSETCGRAAVAAHAIVSAREQAPGILKVSLIELLSRKLGKENDRKQYAEHIMAKAMTYLKINDEERKKGESAMGICATTNIIIAPKEPTAAKFRDDFCEDLRAATKHGNSIIVTNESRPQEISIVTLMSIFPARFGELVKFLKTKYEERIAARGKRSFLELHSEGESNELAPGQELFDLFTETYRPADIISWILLAQSLGLIVADKDKTGRDLLYFKKKDKDDFEIATPLGSNLESAIENVARAPKDVEDIKSTIRMRLADDYLHIIKRRELESAIMDHIRSSAETMGINSDLYKLEKEALSSVRKILEIEG